jgi:hypothetical protein
MTLGLDVRMPTARHNAVDCRVDGLVGGDVVRVSNGAVYLIQYGSNQVIMRVPDLGYVPSADCGQADLSLNSAWSGTRAAAGGIVSHVALEGSGPRIRAYGIGGR